VRKAMQEATAQVEERRAAAQQELDGMTARLSQLQHREATITQRVTELRSLFANAFSGFDFGDAQPDQHVQQSSDDVDDSADAKSSAEAKQAQRDVQAALAESEESNESDEYSESDESQEN
ncbi:cell division protein, partial [Bifidobacteriaceae bacterium NR003]